MTTLMTDCWNRYINLKYLGFIHLTEDYSQNFVDPTTGTNTQAIENN
ncbi:hypothetical protein H312_02413 [Anncaliia algerae PRA339]|uniref:ISXO2-like transposase domain-containing protein n=1 Tax=Anncaliia algerae PRA339 TaxID=1288291 RepID=A0A059EZ99_9MICR|nr:hypothetical protein H312_02413 [Anncaliia algerae PRA339]